MLPVALDFAEVKITFIALHVVVAPHASRFASSPQTSSGGEAGDVSAAPMQISSATFARHGPPKKPSNFSIATNFIDMVATAWVQ